MWLDSFSLSLASPLGTAAGKITCRRGLLVGLTVDGQRGIGEATPLAGWTESDAACRHTLESLAVDGDDGGLPELPDPTETPAAAHAVDLAVCDGRARNAGQPLAVWLRQQADIGGSPPDSVPLNATIGDGDIETTVSAATDAVEAGFEWLKLKVGSRSVEADLDRIRAVDRAVGDTVRIRLDANGAWNRTQATSVLDGIVDLDIEYLEQPLAAADLDGMAGLRGRGTDIAVDESLATHSLDDVLDAGAADAVILKPMALGGPRRTVDIAMRARDAGLRPVVTTTVDAVVARTAAVHTAAAIPDVTACGLATGSLLAADLAADPVEITRGRAQLPTADGLCGGCFDELWAANGST